ncbi:hypothetical protein AM571_PB00306 (plasmid) [Rhizobium etli 8C-3]|uniref:Uncharacterized protein n=1 Tax=Rhizobium etli 8C-3 TaxID=538025 RepID=A0A1L5PBN8_RHIET|nr:hypothetical protein AM571_PB00306 [Rhizobium etli 8C-3]
MGLHTTVWASRSRLILLDKLENRQRWVGPNERLELEGIPEIKKDHPISSALGRRFGFETGRRAYTTKDTERA